MRKFNELIFGSSHPYGQKVEAEDFGKVEQKQLSEFYYRHYSSAHCKIIISGKVDESVKSKIEEYFGKTEWNNIDAFPSRYFKSCNNGPVKFPVPKPDSVQSAVRTGKLLVKSDHPDYSGMMVLNTVLGGYFGSRLMSKIREEKGYTYGIGSALVSLRNAGYFFISTEVASGACSEAINDIHGEIRKLREELISDAELNRVRSYMLGDILRQFDGPFASADNLRYLLDLGLDYGFYDKIIHTIRNVTPDDLNVLANKYFQEDSFTEVIAGRNN
jgi:predicted Zn-dependent peptidase